MNTPPQQDDYIQYLHKDTLLKWRTMMSATHIHIDGIVLITSLLFASLLVLLGSSFYVLHDDIELKLITDVRERLEEADYQVSIDFDGRDGTISGNVADEKTMQEIVKIAKSVAGVRTITNKIALTTNNTTTTSGEVTGNDLITGITDQSSTSVVSINDLASTSISDDISKDTDTSSQNITEITEQPIVKESVILYETNEIKLSLKHITTLNLIVPLLSSDPSLRVEMSSFYKDPAIAIKRTDIIKGFFKKEGIDKKYFEVLWNDSSGYNQVKIKLFHSKGSELNN